LKMLLTGDHRISPSCSDISTISAEFITKMT